MVTDYERAWVRLQAFVAGKTQHGREGLLAEMAEIAADCQVPAGDLARLLRLYGVEVARTERLTTETDRAERGAFPDGLGSSGDPELAGHHRPGGHDGHGAQGNLNGRARQRDD